MVSFIFLHAYIVYTEPVMQQCTMCNREYRTYIPNTICRLPDGGCTMYQDPQLTCPMCDPMEYGDFIRHLPRTTPEASRRIKACMNTYHACNELSVLYYG